LSARQREMEAALGAHLVEDAVHLVVTELLAPRPPWQIRELAVEVVAVDAAQIAVQRQLERDVQGDTALEGALLEPLVVSHACGSARSSSAPSWTSSSTKRAVSVRATSGVTSNSAASSAAISSTSRVPSASSQIRCATGFKPSSSRARTRSRT